MWFTCVIPAFGWFFVDTWMQLLMMLKDLSWSPKETNLYIHGWSKGVGCPCAKRVEGLSVKQLCHGCGWLWVTLTCHCHGRGAWLVPLRGTVCSCKAAFSLQHSQPCVFCPSINRWDSWSPCSAGSADIWLQLLCLDCIWSQPTGDPWSTSGESRLVTVHWCGACSPCCAGWAPFTAELAMDMQQLFSPSSSRGVWQTLNPRDGKKDSSKMFGCL